MAKMAYPVTDLQVIADETQGRLIMTIQAIVGMTQR
jgi:hypothetical protein